MSLLKTLFANCRDVTYLHQKQREGKLSFAENIGYRLHLLYCKVCRLFIHQSEQIEQCVHQSANKHTAELSANAKVKIQRALDNEMK